MKHLRVANGGGAAWRARYLYWGQQQLARIVLDPNGGTKPRLTLAAPIGWYRSCPNRRCVRLLTVALPMPYIPWGWCMRTRYARPVMAAYRLSQRFWHAMDGRYGWRGSVKRPT